MRLALAAVLALAACEGTATTETPERDRSRVTAEDLDEVLGRVEALERERDELLQRVEELEAATGIEPGQEPWPARGTILAEVDCSTIEVPDGTDRVPVQPGLTVEPLGPLVGLWTYHPASERPWHLALDETPGPVDAVCGGSVDRWVWVAL